MGFLNGVLRDDLSTSMENIRKVRKFVVIIIVLVHNYSTNKLTAKLSIKKLFNGSNPRDQNKDLQGF